VVAADFTFSLTLGDYITPGSSPASSSSERHHDNISVANNPVRRACAFVPIVMIGYL
jgi:hypothetical protein